MTASCAAILDIPRTARCLAIILAVAVCSPAPARGDELDRILDSANRKYQHGDFHGALAEYARGLESAKAQGKKGAMLTLALNIGAVQTNLGDYAKALDYFSESLRMSRELGDKEFEGKNLDNIGVFYENLGDYPKALDYDSRTLKTL